jgi:transcriptional regulator with XRE-family HTH domain
MTEDFFKSRNQAIYERILQAFSVNSPSELARLLKISRQTVNEWRSGRNAPTKKRLQEIGEKTGKALDWLSDGIENQQTRTGQIDIEKITQQALLGYFSDQIGLLKEKIGKDATVEFLKTMLIKLSNEPIEMIKKKTG